MDTPKGGGRGRGRGSPGLREGPESTKSHEERPVTTRGRGRGVHLQPVEVSPDPSPVTLPENPEDDDFLAAFRRLQFTGTSAGRGRGRGSSVSCPLESEDSGFVSRDVAVASTSVSELARSGGVNVETRIPVSSRSVTAHSSRPVGAGSSEMFSDLERVSVVKRGETGRPVPIYANFLMLSIEKDMGIYEYHADFEPPLESFRYRKKIIRSLEPKLGPAQNFDGTKLYLAIELPDKVSEFNVHHPNNPSELVNVKVKFVKQNSLAECVHFYNVLFRRIMEILGLVEMKRNYYDHRAVYDIPHHKLEIWPGYVTAIDDYEGGLMLCCDSSFRVLCTATILEKLENFHQENRSVDESKQRFLDYVLGKIVLTKYNNRNYRIDDVYWNQNPLSKFTNSRGQELTFVKYYKDAYNIDIKNMKQPLLVHRPKPLQKKGPVPLICLVPELCYVTGMDSDLTSNYTIMKDLAVYTKLTPAQRNLALQKFAKNVNECPEAKAILDMWGLTLKETAVKLEGRVLTIPQVQLGRGNKFFPDSANFGNKIMSNSVYDPVPIREWQLFFAGSDRVKADKFVEMCQRVSAPFGIPFSFNQNQAMNVGKGSVRDFRSALEKHLNPRVQFVVIIVPSQRDDLYAMIKKMCTIHHPIPSQVILSRTLGDERKLKAIVQKIVLQINCKIGGSLWMIRNPLPEKIMFIGMDVYHDPRRRNFSATGIVGTLNKDWTKYYSRVIFQDRHQETVNSLPPILCDMLIAFAQENNGYPDRIIVWRDGVSDGQLMYTKGHEVAQVLNAFKSLSINPKFTFCVVQKRINARLFLKGEYDPSPLSNPEPGTVVDHTITRKYLYDFFLVSQLVRDGTVTPTHYVVLEDNSEIPPGLIQKFAFCSSFMYYNWTGSIRVPAMCQYAHKLASLVGQYTHAEPALELSKNLYYL